MSFAVGVIGFTAIVCLTILAFYMDDPAMYLLVGFCLGGFFGISGSVIGLAFVRRKEQDAPAPPPVYSPPYGAQIGAGGYTGLPQPPYVEAETAPATAPAHQLVDTDAHEDW